VDPRQTVAAGSRSREPLLGRSTAWMLEGSDVGRTAIDAPGRVTT
jgi:hypothetical protein